MLRVLRWLGPILAAFSVLAAISPVASAREPRAVTVQIDFDQDSRGLQDEPFTSDDSAHVHFRDSFGSQLRVDDFLHQSLGQGLSVARDDPSFLVMNFDAPVGGISLWFGNDDPCCTEQGDRAVLSVYRSGRQVGQASVILNRNDRMDQRIVFVGGVLFDSATFLYEVSTRGLIEIVDHIVIYSAS